MGCSYITPDGKKYTIKSLLTEFYEEKLPLTNSSIYSSENIQKSTINILTTVSNKAAFNDGKSEAINIGETVNPDDYIGNTANNNQSVTRFIVEENPIFTTILGLEGQTRLNPEYILEKRIKQYVLDNYNKDVLLTTPPSKEMLDIVLKELGEGYDENKVAILVGKIEDIIKEEEKIKRFGYFLHTAISLKLLGKLSEYNSYINKFIENPNNKDIIGNSVSSEWIPKIESIISHIQNQVELFGVPLTEIAVKYENASGTINLSGKIDLIAVDLNGIPHIFEIKISKNRYSDWDSAKLNTLDWQLMVYSQMLSQHIDTTKSQLHVIPVVMPEIGNPNLIFVEDIKNRKAESSMGLYEGGRVYNIANRLIPKRIIIDYDPTRENAFSKVFEKLLPQEELDYSIQTGVEDTSREGILKRIKERQIKNGGKFMFYNEFSDIEGVKKGYIEANTIEELEKILEPYFSYMENVKNKNAIIFKEALQTAMKNNSTINTRNEKRDIMASILLKEYLNNSWEIIDDLPEAITYGLIILRHKDTGNINIISLTSNQLLATTKDSEYSYGELEYIKTFLFLNEYKNILFPSNTSYLNEIIVYNPVTGESYPKATHAMYKSFVSRMYAKGFKEEDIKLKDSALLNTVNIALFKVKGALQEYSLSDKKDLEGIFAPIAHTNFDQLQLSQLVEIQKAFFEKYTDYKERTLTPTMSFNDPKEVIFAMLQTAIVSKSSLELAGDFQRLSNYSLQFSDFWSLIKKLYTDKNPDYDKEGRAITGIFQGLKWTTPDWVASKDLKNINKLMSLTNNHIREKMLMASQRIHNFSGEYYNSIGFSSESQLIVGESQSKHEEFWVKNGDKISEEFRVKNPYKNDPENAMSETGRKYLKRMLLEINMWKYNIPSNVIDKINPDNLDDLLKVDAIRTKIESGEYFEMPLVRRDEWSKYKNILSSLKRSIANGKTYLMQRHDFLDSKELQKEDLDLIKLQNMGYYEMYDLYGRQTKEYKAKVIGKYSVDFFDINLDTIAHRLAFNKIRKNEFDKTLPIINAYIWCIKLVAGKQSEDISKQLEYISDQVKLSVLDEPIIDEEFKDVATVVTGVKSITTAMMLALRPVLFFKEMTIGVFKGAALAATQIYGKDQFSIKDLSLAYTKLATIDNKFSNEFNMIDRINQMYGFANMDVNTLAKKLQTNRWGVFKGLGPYMYACNTIPDYFNRLSLFIAKMIHDGSYEAHSYENGFLKYDPKKDKRFSYYLANRHKHKDKNGNYIPAQKDEEYNRQRNHYLLLMSMLNSEYLDNKLVEEDLLPKAYSEKERSSFKSFTDMAYGYYDKDTQSQSTNLWWGLTWMQFMQFWPGKMRMWFGKTVDENNSPMGRVVQATKKVDGKEIPLWRKTIQREDGSYDVEPTEENTGDPLLEWKGTPYEGLAYSVLSTVRDLATLNFSEIKNKKDRLGRVAFALNDALLMFLLLALFKAMLDSWIDDNGDAGLSVEIMEFASSVNNKVLNEHNIWQSTLGALSTDPAWASWGSKLGSDIGSVLEGNKTFMDAASRSVGALEMFKE